MDEVSDHNLVIRSLSSDQKCSKRVNIQKVQYMRMDSFIAIFSSHRFPQTPACLMQNGA